MARTSATVNAPSLTNSTPSEGVVTQTTIDATLVTNGLDITDFFNHKDPVLRVYNSYGSTITVTLVAGTADPAIARGIGNYSWEIATGAIEVLDQIESARFFQGDGSLYVNFSTGATGTIEAIGQSIGIG